MEWLETHKHTMLSMFNVIFPQSPQWLTANKQAVLISLKKWYTFVLLTLQHVKYKKESTSTWIVFIVLQTQAALNHISQTAHIFSGRTHIAFRNATSSLTDDTATQTESRKKVCWAFSSLKVGFFMDLALVEHVQGVKEQIVMHHSLHC